MRDGHLYGSAANRGRQRRAARSAASPLHAGLDPGLGRATAEPLLEEGGSLAAFVNGPLVSGLKRLEALEPCLAEKRPDRGPCVAKGLQYGVEQ